MALSYEDKKLLINGLNGILSQVPSFLKGTINSKLISGYIQAIPNNFRNYSLQELIDAIEEGNRNNSFNW